MSSSGKTIIIHYTGIVEIVTFIFLVLQWFFTYKCSELCQEYCTTIIPFARTALLYCMYSAEYIFNWQEAFSPVQILEDIVLWYVGLFLLVI
jgi:hypothetical protein